MKLSKLEPTPDFVELDGGLLARIWTGQTESGVSVRLFVAAVQVPDAGVEEFERSGLVEFQPGAQLELAELEKLN